MRTGGQGYGAHTRVALLSALLTLAASVPGLAADAVPTPGDPTPIAAVVHLLGGPTPDFPAPASEVRAAAFEALSALSGARGRLLADRTRTEELVRTHRIRSGSLLTSAFLTDLRAGTGAGTLLAVGLLAEDGRLSVTVRAIDTADGRLTAIGLAETVPTAESWRTALTEGLRQAYPGLAATTAGGRPLLVLPARTVGLDAKVGRTATSCVLAEALAGGGWSLLDPALVTGAATAAGCDLERLDRDGRALLGERCGVSWAVVPEVVSFDVMNEAGAGRAPVDDEGGFAARRAATLALSLQLLDLRTGLIRSAVSLTVSGDPRVGWFGHLSQPTEVEQLRSAAAQLWTRLRHILEEQNS